MSSKKRIGLLSFFRGGSPPEPENFSEGFYYEQIAASVGAGGWTVDFENKKSYFDKQLRTILNTPSNYHPSFKYALQFYDKAYHRQLIQVYEDLKKGVPYEAEVQMIAYDGRKFWARCIGKPIFGSKKKVTAIRGIILNIDDRKTRELAIENSLKSIEATNDRLFKFANYISHNLRNHINNLELTSQLVDIPSLEDDQKELFGNYEEIASGLSRTVQQLNEVVTIQKKVKEESVILDLQTVFEKCKSDLQNLIEQKDGSVYSDFSEVPEVKFNKDFFENIFCSLIKNGLRNERSDRKPEIKAYSIEQDGKVSVIIEDNGVGIDVEDSDEFIYYTYGSGEFKSRNNSIDLFIVKNQVEALGARLEIKSKPGYGTKFIINF
ncbi:PAS domain-containing sensor histidine kinase [Flavimarina sp. Hel_I_48]|uniref:PAS domain-containing sensor histidine kinase n=1 Tax=Flavimarina sp. Hel_I_48 TaxID=1392488 RepID=UPI0004DF5892|nr:PAS domain-containing sensor histidine kinase [Flavimarina sp. Hel_I_48]